MALDLEGAATKVSVASTKTGINVFPLKVEELGADTHRTLMALQFAVAFVLLIACANVINLQLSRAAAREKKLRCAWLWARDAGALPAKCSVKPAAERRRRWSRHPAGLLGNRRDGRADARRHPPARRLAHRWRRPAFMVAITRVTGILFGTAPAILAARQDPNHASARRTLGRRRLSRSHPPCLSDCRNRAVAGSARRSPA